MAFSKEYLDSLCNELREAVEKIANEHNLTVGRPKIFFDEVTMTFKIDLGDAEKTEGCSPTFYKKMEKYGHKYNLGVEIIGKKFKVSPKTGERVYLILGMSSSTEIYLKNLNDSTYSTMKASNFVEYEIMNRLF